MAFSSHMAFARNRAGQLVAANDLPSVGPAIFYCAGCGGEVTLCRQDASQADFRHVRPAACELGAQRALHAAAVQLLAESRFVVAPALTQKGTGHCKRHMIEEWGLASVRTTVDGIPVDFFAETLAGPMIIQIAIKSLYNASTRSTIRALGYAALEISIPKPGEVLGIGDLREVVLHGLTNKVWLWHPAIGNRERHAQPKRRPAEVALLFGEVEKPAAKLSVPVAVTPWVQAGGLAADAAYRQLPVAEKIRALEQQLGEPCARWPDAVDVDVTGKGSFCVDPRVWQADIFGKFVRPAAEGASTRDFTMLTVLGWLDMRYRIVPAFEDAEKVAVHQYLLALTAQGYLAELPDQQFRVVPEPRPNGLSTLRWNPDARLSVSGLRVCSERVRLEIPVNQVQRLLEYFEDGHPAVSVATFVQDLMLRLHAPERTVVALLREADLVVG
ncbi:hypothetical protein [Paraburkholderia tuberum]|uniref:Competence protein CoiA-like family protein n=1 Tax=Paraburkholderia tuberum TaxID=157910 RepID=A0A1H1KIU9_9BURK|nr:hypothetical protein [Paraburkholderia tuberum]SDR61920.1 hypothetical protein SAMN05445850_8039 [Paraburkholderia tuberum]